MHTTIKLSTLLSVTCDWQRYNQWN